MRTQDLRIYDLGPGTLDPRPQDPVPGIYLDDLLFTLPEAAWEKGGGGKFSLNLANWFIKFAKTNRIA